MTTHRFARHDVKLQGLGATDVPRPATIVIDRDGVARWTLFAHNVQVRPDAREVLRAVRGL